MTEVHRNYQFDMAVFRHKLDLEAARDWQRSLPEASIVIAVDGAVPEAPSWSYGEGALYVADHHAMIDDRLTTEASCKQVERIIGSQQFREQTKRIGRVTMAFCTYDPDVAEAGRLLMADSIGLYNGASSEVIARNKRLTNWEDRTDRTSGGWLKSHEAAAPFMRYIYEPAMRIRWQNIRDLQQIISAQTEVNRRAMDYALGLEIRHEAQGQFEKLGAVGQTILIKETGPFAVASAMEAFRQFVSERVESDGTRHLSVHSQDGVLPEELWAALNEVERVRNPDIDSADDWGGCAYAGGDPFDAGTMLGLEEAGTIVEFHTQEERVRSNAARARSKQALSLSKT